MTSYLQIYEIKHVIQKSIIKTLSFMRDHTDKVKQLINHSFLSSRLKRNYEQAHLIKLKKLIKM